MLRNSFLLFALTAISSLVSAQPGSLLPTIPRVQAGTTLVDFGSSSDFAFASAIQRDGKLVLGRVNTILASAAVQVSMHG